MAEEPRLLGYAPNSSCACFYVAPDASHAVLKAPNALFDVQNETMIVADGRVFFSNGTEAGTRFFLVYTDAPSRGCTRCRHCARGCKQCYSGYLTFAEIAAIARKHGPSGRVTIVIDDVDAAN